MNDLFDSSSAGQVCDEDVDQGLETSGINDHLDLLVIASGDVGDDPGACLDNLHLWMLQELGKDWDDLVLENSISLSVVTCHNVTQGPETWIHHLEFSAVQEADQVGNHTSIHNNLDLLLWTICQVGQGAADIGQDLCVGVLDKLSEYWETLLHYVEWWRRVLVPAQVGDGPGHVPQEGGGGVLQFP